MTKVSITMSCYNEEANLKRGVLDELNNFLSRQKFDWEVVISNDISTDNSYQLLLDYSKKHPKFRVFNLDKKGGKPGGIWNSIQHAKYPICLMTDVDQSTPVKEIAKLLPFFDQGYDVVIGSRGSQRIGFSLLRQLGSKVFLFVRRALLLHDIVDTQCGFKAIKTSVAKKIFPHLAAVKTTTATGWHVTSYDVEMLFLAQKLGYKIKEVPVKWQNEDTSDSKGDFGERYKKESIQMAKEVYRIKMNDLRGVYDKIKK